MEIISSVKNPLIVKIKKIKENFDNKLFLENPKTIEEAYLQNISFDICLIDADKKESVLQKNPFLKNCKTVLVKDNVLKSVCDTKTPQGVAVVANIKPLKLKEPEGNFLVLENLQDPGNLGTIIRSARGTDFKDIYLINCVSPYNQKVVRSTMGAIFSQNLCFFKTSTDFLNFAKQNELSLCAADMAGENLFGYKKPNENFGLVIGNEGSGVSIEMKNACKYSVSIPMKNGLESLNAGVACSILMYYFDNI